VKDPEPSPRTLTVSLRERSYPVWIGANLFSKINWNEIIPTKQVLVVTDDTVAPLYLDKLIAVLSDRRVATVILPTGEYHKTLRTAEQIWEVLTTHQFHRDSCTIALGGGVIGDVAGFAAACYMRGISFLPIPTTLLAQVDSSVGGKTAVNLRQAKNLVGAFHQPTAVVIDIATLSTLPNRQFQAGLAEVVKYAAIRDANFFLWLEGNADKLLAHRPESLSEAIFKSCQHKAEIVSRDEREHGERTLLNFGHTFGHAIETISGYSLLHGEAVSMGMILAAQLSEQLGLSEKSATQRLMALLKRFRLPTELPKEIAPTKLLNLMQIDKKNRDGQLRLILWRGIGSAEVVGGISSASILKVLAS